MPTSLRLLPIPCALLLLAVLRAQTPSPDAAAPADLPRIAPVLSTRPVSHDADDPAIWVDREHPERSLIVGTNKVAAPDGGLYVFDLDGAVTQVVTPLDRPNNVDIEYGLATPGGSIDIAVATERLQGRLRIYQVNARGLTAIDGGGVPVLAGMTGEAAMPMGIALYRRPNDGAIFAIVAPKTGGATGYLWQYRLAFDATAGQVTATFVRRFGAYSGSGEIEAVAVDDALGAVYFSDEEYGVRKWAADPDARDAATELAVFGRGIFTLQREGIALIARPDGTGFVVVSDQIPGATELKVFRREGTQGAPHAHDPAAAVIRTAADSTDGLEITTAPLGPRFPGGVLVMMNSAGRNFQIYDLRDVLRVLDAAR